MNPTDQEKPDAKKSLSMGCVTVLVSFAMVLVSVVVAIIFNPDSAVNQVEVDGEKTRYSMVETVTPKTFNSVVVELDLKGERYFTYRTGKKKIGVRDKRPQLGALAYQIPIRVEVTRVRDGEVILDHRHVFEIEPHEKDNVAKDKGEFEEFGTRVELPRYPEVRAVGGTTHQPHSRRGRVIWFKNQKRNVESHKEGKIDCEERQYFGGDFLPDTRKHFGRSDRHQMVGEIWPGSILDFVKSGRSQSSRNEIGFGIWGQVRMALF